MGYYKKYNGLRLKYYYKDFLHNGNTTTPSFLPRAPPLFPLSFSLCFLSFPSNKSGGSSHPPPHLTNINRVFSEEMHKSAAIEGFEEDIDETIILQ